MISDGINLKTGAIKLVKHLTNTRENDEGIENKEKDEN